MCLRVHQLSALTHYSSNRITSAEEYANATEQTKYSTVKDLVLIVFGANCVTEPQRSCIKRLIHGRFDGELIQRQ